MTAARLTAMPRFLIPYFQAGHALFNSGLFIAFVYHGWNGWRIRRKRLGGGPQDSGLVRRHRAMGPFLAKLLPVGYLAGLLLSFLDHGTWARYSLHLGVGTVLVSAVVATWIISRKIRGPQSAWRTPHFLLGIAILILFLGQIFLGLGVLL